MHGPVLPSSFSRRHFILTAASATGGLVVHRVCSGHRRAAPSRNNLDENDHAPHESTLVASDPDDSILIRYQRSEMEGAMTRCR